MPADALSAARRDVRRLSSARRAKANRWFFKTRPGEYGHGDRFLGVTVPDLRRVARAHAAMPLKDVLRLLKSPWHEERLLALLIMVRQHERADDRRRAALYRAYLRHTRWINNWDLVDSSAAQIVGTHPQPARGRELRRLAQSTLVWDRRIAMIATYRGIRDGDSREALTIAERLVGDDHDLIHKAVGWMLREVGNRDRAAAERFLRRHARTMPRTMLRYAIERFPERLRQRYLSAGRAGR